MIITAARPVPSPSNLVRLCACERGKTDFVFKSDLAGIQELFLEPRTDTVTI